MIPGVVAVRVIVSLAWLTERFAHIAQLPELYETCGVNVDPVVPIAMSVMFPSWYPHNAIIIALPIVVGCGSVNTKDASTVRPDVCCTRDGVI
jgi:hypothetical protein